MKTQTKPIPWPSVGQRSGQPTELERELDEALEKSISDLSKRLTEIARQHKEESKVTDSA